MLIQRFTPASASELDEMARSHQRNQIPSLRADGRIEIELYECSKCTRESKIKCSRTCVCQCHC